MMVKSNRKTWLINPILATAFMLASGCAPEESAPTSAPTSPLPNAPPSRPQAPPVPPDTNPVKPGETKVEKDLRKDLGGPVIKPDTTTTPPPPETKKP
jgi:hypothetical protein